MLIMEKNRESQYFAEDIDLEVGKMSSTRDVSAEKGPRGDPKEQKRNCIVPHTDENEAWSMSSPNDARSTGAIRNPVTVARADRQSIAVRTDENEAWSMSIANDARSTSVRNKSLTAA